MPDSLPARVCVSKKVQNGPGFILQLCWAKRKCLSLLFLSSGSPVWCGRCTVRAARTVHQGGFKGSLKAPAMLAFLEVQKLAASGLSRGTQDLVASRGTFNCGTWTPECVGFDSQGARA